MGLGRKVQVPDLVRTTRTKEFKLCVKMGAKSGFGW